MPPSTPSPTPPASSTSVLLGSPELTAGIPGNGPLKVDEVKAWLADPANHAVLTVELPTGLAAGQSQIKGLDKNPLTRAKIELGRQLYFDTRLSKDNTVSCASCHAPDAGYTAHTKTGVGINGQTGDRNSPVSYNRILSDVQFWDGRAPSLEEQAKGPIQNPIEMGNTHEAVVKLLQANEVYRLQFEKIFGKVDIEAVAQAIASFERAIVSGPSPFDFYDKLQPFAALDLADLKTDDPKAFADYERLKKLADAHPMSESAQRGHKLFFGNKASCTACHVGPNLSDEKYHNLGVGMDAAKPDLGRFNQTKDAKDTGAFKTPTIRNVALSAPYMHDGSHATLEDVVAWYDKGGLGGEKNPHLSDKIKKLSLTDEEKKDLVEFMKACTGELPKVATGRLPE